MSTEKKVPRSELIKDVYKTISKNGKYPFEIRSEKDVRTVYNAIVETIVKKAVAGNTVVLPRFGSFYVTTHKGHPVFFESIGGNNEIKDYRIFKFSPSSWLKKYLRESEA